METYVFITTLLCTLVTILGIAFDKHSIERALTFFALCYAV